MPKSAQIVYGGWDGHQPREVAEVFRRVLTEEGFAVDVSDSLSAWNDAAKLATYDLIVPHWTMGQLTPEQQTNICTAIRNGAGIAGCHGGMCDSFRTATEYQFMTGGQWVAHPGNDGVKYPVQMTKEKSPITEGIGNFEITSEQYYLHVDPAVRVLATVPFPVADGPHVLNGHVDMPTIWTKFYGKGRVFYSAIGHQASVVASEPHLTIVRRGFLWATR
jgi:type 1 glutamine amidotransferase